MLTMMDSRRSATLFGLPMKYLALLTVRFALDTLAIRTPN
jgi:hypothetical protein